MSQERIMITSPVVRIVQGDIYNPSKTDMKGTPLVYKTGSDIGKPRVDYFLKTAEAKTPGHTHWAQGDFGKQIWAAGGKLWNGNTNLFWKIEDGDDATPNIDRKGKKNCDNEGWPGHWIMKFGSAFAPKLVHMVGGQAIPLTEEGAIKCGDYVQVYFEVRSNNEATKPGLLYNPIAICFISGSRSGRLFSSINSLTPCLTQISVTFAWVSLPAAIAADIRPIRSVSVTVAGCWSIR